MMLTPLQMIWIDGITDSNNLINNVKAELTWAIKTLTLLCYNYNFFLSMDIINKCLWGSAWTPLFIYSTLSVKCSFSSSYMSSNNNGLLSTLFPVAIVIFVMCTLPMGTCDFYLHQWCQSPGIFMFSCKPMTNRYFPMFLFSHKKISYVCLVFTWYDLFRLRY